MSNGVQQRPRRKPTQAAKASSRRRKQVTKRRKRQPPVQKRRKQSRQKARTRVAFGRIFGRSFVLRLVGSIVVALLLGLLLILTLRVRSISVVGNSLYSTEEICDASGVAEGNVLLLVNKTAVASRIRAQLPYIDEVRVGISLPGTMKLEVVELETTFAVAANDGSYWLINSGGRLIEQITAKAASEYVAIEGVRIQNAVVGAQVEVMPDPIEPEDEESSDEEDAQAAPPKASARERMDAALKILSELEEREETRSITTVDVTSVYDLAIWYGTRFEVKLGDTSELSYKLEYMFAAIAQLESQEGGVLDLTFHEAKKATFVPWSD